MLAWRAGVHLACVQVCLEAVEKILFECALRLGDDWGADDLNAMEGSSAKPATRLSFACVRA